MAERAHITEPVRTCVGCGARAEKSAMVRLVRQRGRVTVDLRSRVPGRGAYVHADANCVGRAERGGLSRAFRTSISMAEASALANVLGTTASSMATSAAMSGDVRTSG